ncbi:MAG: hypothetical protein SPF56_08170 [Bacteroidaceae bacterium]|nr:hypothetical protein [Bacteroidaceae bacterium]
MKTTSFFAIMAAALMMSTVTAHADNRYRNNRYGRYDRQDRGEVYFNSNTGRLEDRVNQLEDRLYDVEDRQDRQDDRLDRMDYRQDRMDRYARYNGYDRYDRYDRYDIRGYEDRVRYRGGRWHYHRNGRWYGYDYYITPSYYYSRPLSTFGKAVVGAAVVGAVVSALVR